MMLCLVFTRMVLFLKISESGGVLSCSNQGLCGVEYGYKDKSG